MQCPICKDIALVMTERQSIEIDYCRNAAVSGLTEVNSTRLLSVVSDKRPLDCFHRTSHHLFKVRRQQNNLVTTSTGISMVMEIEGATAVDGKKVAIKVKVGIRDNRVAKNRFCRNYLIKMAISRL